MGMARAGDGDRDQTGSEARGPERFHNRRPYSAGIDHQSFNAIGSVDQVANAAHDFKIVSPEGERFDMAEHEAQLILQFESYRIATASGVMASFEDGDGRGVLPTA